MICALMALEDYGSVQICSKMCNTAFEHTQSRFGYLHEELERYFSIADANNGHRYQRPSIFETLGRYALRRRPSASRSSRNA